MSGFNDKRGNDREAKRDNKRLIRKMREGNANSERKKKEENEIDN